jgi:hypothetical protein
MSVRVRIKGKEYTVKETVRNVEKTYIIQKKFLSLAGKADEAAKSFDAEELNASAMPSITETIQSNLDNLNAVAEYIADMVNSETITVDFLKDNLLYDDFQSLLFKLINGILHIDDEGAAEGKK